MGMERIENIRDVVQPIGVGRDCTGSLPGGSGTSCELEVESFCAGRADELTPALEGTCRVSGTCSGSGTLCQEDDCYSIELRDCHAEGNFCESTGGCELVVTLNDSCTLSRPDGEAVTFSGGMLVVRAHVPGVRLETVEPPADTCGFCHGLGYGSFLPCHGCNETGLCGLCHGTRTMPVACETCGGTTRSWGYTSRDGKWVDGPCATCSGSGRTSTQCIGCQGRGACGTCGGARHLGGERCSHCGGSGRLSDASGSVPGASIPIPVSSPGVDVTPHERRFTVDTPGPVIDLTAPATVELDVSVHVPAPVTYRSLTFEFTGSYEQNVVGRIDVMEFTNALLTETTIPTLDAAAKDTAFLTVKLTPEMTVIKPGTGAPAAGTFEPGPRVFTGHDFTVRGALDASGTQPAVQYVVAATNQIPPQVYVAINDPSVTRPVSFVSERLGVPSSETAHAVFQQGLWRMNGSIPAGQAVQTFSNVVAASSLSEREKDRCTTQFTVAFDAFVNYKPAAVGGSAGGPAAAGGASPGAAAGAAGGGAAEDPSSGLGFFEVVGMVMSFATSPFRDHGFGCSRPPKVIEGEGGGVLEAGAEPEGDTVMLASEGGAGQAPSTGSGQPPTGEGPPAGQEQRPPTGSGQPPTGEAPPTGQEQRPPTGSGRP